MKVLHIYPKSDDLISRHVTLLAEGMRQSAEIMICDHASTFRKLLKEMKPDIVHCHGCWQFFLAHAAASARKKGARVVITPHGQLEPWVIKRQSIQENVSKTYLWQKTAVERAYAVITLGKLERSNFEKLGWNKRIEEIHNAVITNTISPAQMSALTFQVYQKVMDSNTIEQMNNDSIQALSAILKVSITGDRRWLTTGNLPTYDPAKIDWRRLLIYSEHENIRNYVDYGINILGLASPALDTTKISAYFPDNYRLPQSIKDSIGGYDGDETVYLMRMIRQINKQPLLLHLIELHRELYRDTVNDEQLVEQLEEKRLKGFASRLMKIMSEQTGLDEGYMPIAAIDDKQTAHIRKLLTNHLKI